MIRRYALAILLPALLACERPGSPDQPAGAAISRAQAEVVYLRNCAICHGAKGDGRGPRRGSLFAKPPDFRQLAWRRGKNAAEIRSAIREGRPGSDMPAWKNLDEADVAGLAEYVLAFADRDASDEQ